jgi:hypothetical protein
VLCPSCGAEHDPTGGGFCEACGLWVGRTAAAAALPHEADDEDDEAWRPCPECGVRVARDLTSCRQCGARMRSTDQDDDAAAEMRRRRILRERDRAGATTAAVPAADAPAATADASTADAPTADASTADAPTADAPAADAPAATAADFALETAAADFAGATVLVSPDETPPDPEAALDPAVSDFATEAGGEGSATGDDVVDVIFAPIPKDDA